MKQKIIYSIDKLRKSKMRMRNNNKILVMGKRCIFLCTKQCDNKKIQDACYVHVLGHNLITNEKIVQKEYMIMFENG